MKRSARLTAATLGAAGLAAAAIAGCSSPASQSVSVQTNQLAFNGNNGSGGPPVGYVFSGDYSVTAGQPWQGVTGCPSAVDNCTITVMAGRNKTTPVAQWFTQNAPTAYCTGDCGGSQPSELNFAFTGTITINSSSYPITLGQGSSSPGVNNWWFGGSGWTYQKVGEWNSLVTPDGQYYLTQGMDSAIQVGAVS